MGLETATFVSQLNVLNPVGGSDPKSQGDDHFRLIKSVLKNTFPNASKAYYFPTSSADVAGDVTVQLTDDGKTFPVNATVTARLVSLPATPPDGFEITVVKTDSSANVVTIDPPGAVLINGVATKSLTFQFESITCRYLATFAQWIGLRSPQGTPFDLSQVLPIANGGSGQDTAAEAFDAFSTARADVASASTVDLDTNNSSYARITGTTTITAITLTSGRKRWVVFAGALTLTNGASLILPTAANIVTVAGDTALFVGEAAGVVRCLRYERSNGLPLAFPSRAYGEYTANEAITDVIPIDNTIPQNGEGFELTAADCTITLKRADSRVRIIATAFGRCVSAVGDDNRKWTLALFRDSVANALRAVAGGIDNNNIGVSIVASTTLLFEHAPGSVGPFTYKLSAGPGTAGEILRLNGEAAKFYGGVEAVTMTVEEVFV